MGCTGFQVMDEETAKLLASLDRKVEEFHETFERDVKEIKDKQDKQLKERHQELLKLKETESITEQAIKDLNKKELKVEIDILSNAVNKMHYIFDVGLDLVEPLRKITIDKLLEKAKSAPAITVNKIKSQIEDVKKIPVIDFLSSTYGKVLANALEKKGMSEAFLKSTKKSLLAERSERRKKEREEFGIKVNEFDDENIDKMKLDLFALVKQEYKDINKHFKDFARDKMIEGMYAFSNA
jgi:hypothetical protein